MWLLDGDLRCWNCRRIEERYETFQRIPTGNGGSGEFPYQIDIFLVGYNCCYDKEL